MINLHLKPKSLFVDGVLTLMVEFNEVCFPVLWSSKRSFSNFGREPKVFLLVIQINLKSVLFGIFDQRYLFRLAV